MKTTLYTLILQQNYQISSTFMCNLNIFCVFYVYLSFQNFFIFVNIFGESTRLTHQPIRLAHHGLIKKLTQPNPTHFFTSQKISNPTHHLLCVKQANSRVATHIIPIFTNYSFSHTIISTAYDFSLVLCVSTFFLGFYSL